eukprot:scaffold2349_cov407-Prasinococcus_capsulatus_cf.AAC.12
MLFPKLAVTASRSPSRCRSPAARVPPVFGASSSGALPPVRVRLRLPSPRCCRPPALGNGRCQLVAVRLSDRIIMNSEDVTHRHARVAPACGHMPAHPAQRAAFHAVPCAKQAGVLFTLTHTCVWACLSSPMAPDFRDDGDSSH